MTDLFTNPEVVEKMKNAKLGLLSTIGAVMSGIVLSASMIILPVQGAMAADAAKAPAKKAAAKKAPAKKAAMKKGAMKKAAPSAFWKKVQTALIAKGAKIKADGFSGPATRKAIMAFQKANKLKANGKIDAATKKALGLK
jgi:peptidoglycan hydrolase-like protein with peptidoglycan-binding domain